MGEPLTKATLVIHQLVAEEMAFRRLVKSPGIPKPITWRCYCVGGDDILALGPRDYLNDITLNLLKMGAALSKEKHGIYDVVLKYCERLLEVKPLLSGFPFKEITSRYKESPWVDSIKVRLLSPCSKSTETINERNVAIGKLSSLGQTLRWLPAETYSPSRKRFIRDRAIWRHRQFLPLKSSKQFWHLLLPRSLGGLDLWFESDISDLKHRLPNITKDFIRELKSNTCDPQKYLDFKALPRNSTYRGYTLIENDKTKLEKFLLKGNFCEMCQDNLSWWQIKTRFPEVENFPERMQVEYAAGKGYMLLEAIVDMILRPVLFAEVLSNKSRPTAHNTEPWSLRFGKLWEHYYKGASPPLSDEEITFALKYRRVEPFYNLNTIIPGLDYQSGEYVERTLRAELTTGLPLLQYRV
jgi:hypothetical protein